MRRVVVTGMGIVSSLGHTVAAAYERLKTPRNCVRRSDELQAYRGLQTCLWAPCGYVRPPDYTRKVIRTGAPVVCIRETLTRRILAKGQRPWDMGSRRVVFSFRMSAPIPPPVAHGSPHAAAVRLTDAIRAQLASTLREPGKRRAGRSGVCSAAARIDWRCARFSYSP